MSERILIFGGSFDPIHHGHLYIAQTALHALDFAQVRFLPTRQPHHRSALSAAPADRLAMLRLAIAGNTRFAIDTSDLREDASGFTVDVLPHIQAQWPSARLSFLLGEDSLTQSPWHRFDDFVEMLEHVVIAPRALAEQMFERHTALESFLDSLSEKIRRRMIVLDQPRITISATEIRDQQRRGAPIRYLVPDSVRRAILDRQLYSERAAV